MDPYTCSSSMDKSTPEKASSLYEDMKEQSMASFECNKEPQERNNSRVASELTPSRYRPAGFPDRSLLEEVKHAR